MSKKSLTNGVSLKVANRSGFDKSFFNALTTGVGTITPIVKQFMIPNSSGHCRVKISAQLPPLATDAFLRSHLKLEAFFVPMRLCYGGFESWFCGREVYDPVENLFLRAKLPNLGIPDYNNWDGVFDSFDSGWPDFFESLFGAGSLLDYFGAYWRHDEDFGASPSMSNFTLSVQDDEGVKNDEPFVSVNIFPWLSYALIYDEFYRNKFVEKPLFSPPAARPGQDMVMDAVSMSAANLPYFSAGTIMHVVGGSYELAGGYDVADLDGNCIFDGLLNGTLTQLRQRNYGDDYFTAAMPSAQSGNPISVAVTDGAFTIGALRLGSSLQEFEEINGYASPDYIQTLTARYGASLSYGVAQKPIYLGSADFPMYTSGVEQTANGDSLLSGQNPFNSVGSRYGRAHAEGTDFVCDFNVDEPGYFMVMATLVPEAQYFQGIAKDLLWFTQDGSIVDMPVATFENIGNEEVFNAEARSGISGIFGYVQRYLAHKLGNRNQVHGKFRMDEDLGSFVVQRDLAGVTGISTNFLKVKTSDLDNVAAVKAGISGYGVMIDSAIDLFVSEPLSESAIPSLVDPAKEHGHSVYVKTGGSKLA